MKFFRVFYFLLTLSWFYDESLKSRAQTFALLQKNLKKITDPIVILNIQTFQLLAGISRLSRIILKTNKIMFQNRN